MVQFREMTQVPNRGHAAGGNHRQVRAFNHLLCRFEVGSCEYTITRNIRVNDHTSTEFLKSLRQRNCPDVRIFSPTGNLNVSIERIDADGNVVGLFLQSLFDKGRIFDGSRSQHDALNPGIEQAFNNRYASYSTTNLNLRKRHRRRHFTQQIEIFQPAEECAVQIDHMQPLCAFADPLRGRLQGIAVNGRFGPPTPPQPHSFSVKNVDRRINFHRNCPRRTRAKLSRMRSPTCWLFSGWNCVAQMFLAWTIAGNSIS